MAVATTNEQAEAMKEASFFAPYQPMVGTPEEVAAQISCYADLGFSHFILRFADYPNTEGVQLFIREVLPRFK
jgi:alkanesulfonate monooxygenase SsuD/methylene tetrahydromethanopterin reductase-like flavin-dependent oxidoreductase (luciferase family)